MKDILYPSHYWWGLRIDMKLQLGCFSLYLMWYLLEKKLYFAFYNLWNNQKNQTFVVNHLWSIEYGHGGGGQSPLIPSKPHRWGHCAPLLSLGPFRGALSSMLEPEPLWLRSYWHLSAPNNVYIWLYLYSMPSKKWALKKYVVGGFPLLSIFLAYKIIQEAHNM